MFGIGWPDLLFIGLILALVVKPEEWPKIGRVVGKTLRTVREQAAPVIREFRSLSGDLMADEKRPASGTPAPDGWGPLPQSWQKGGESPLDSPDEKRHGG